MRLLLWGLTLVTLCSQVSVASTSPDSSGDSSRESVSTEQSIPWVSVDTFGHYTYRDGAYTSAGGADLKISVFRSGDGNRGNGGALRPLIGAFVAQNLKRYTVAEAGLVYEEFHSNRVSHYIGALGGTSLERKLEWSNLMLGPSIGFSFYLGRFFALSASYTLYLNAGITSQIRAGTSVSF